MDLSELIHKIVKGVTWINQRCSMYFSPFAKQNQDFKAFWSFCFELSVEWVNTLNALSLLCHWQYFSNINETGLFWKCSSVIICESGTFALLVFCATTQTYYGLPNSSIFLEVSPKLPLKVHCLNSCDVFNDFRIPTKGAGGESGSTEKRGNWGKEEKWGRKEKVAWKERPSQRLQIKVTWINIKGFAYHFKVEFSHKTCVKND